MKTLNKPLQKQIVRSQVMNTFIVLLLVSTVILFFGIDEISKSHKNKIFSTADIMTHNLVTPILFDDKKEVSRALMALTTDENFLNAFVTNRSGVLVSKLGVSEFNGELFKHEGSGIESLLSQKIFFKKSIVSSFGENIGWLYLEYSNEYLIGLYRSVLVLLLSLLLLSFLISFILANSMQKIIVLPIERLIVTIKKISLSKNWDDIELIKNEDEILEVSTLKAEFLNMIYTVKEQEKKVLQAKDNAVKASKAKSEFLANMSHELRTPLNAILGYSQIINLSKGEERVSDFKEHTRAIEKSGMHLLALIEDILDISKIEANKVDIYRERLNIRAQINEIVDIIQPLCDENGNELTITIDNNLKEMFTDIKRFKQIILNLLSNACKFTHKGSIVLSLEEYRASKSGEAGVKILVADTGIGMSEGQMAKVFGAFNQADASTTKKYGGTGLGLSITKGLAELMGGTVDVVSELEKGSNFSVYLPLSTSKKETATDDI